MTSSSNPARIPERQPEQGTTVPVRRQTWSRPGTKPTKFVIKLAGAIPS